MHMEYIWKSTDERMSMAQRDIYTMMGDILSMYWIENRGFATIIAYSDEMSTDKWDDKDSWTAIGSSYFQWGIEGANNEKLVKEIAKTVNKNDLIGILKWTKELNNALARLAQESAVSEIPPELGSILKGIVELMAKAKKNDEDEDEDEKPKKKKKKKDSDDDIITGLDNLLR